MNGTVQNGGALKLSIIDQSPVPAGSTPADALRNTIELAQLADRLGYERYWIAEHHAIDALASPAPEILIARLGAETSHLRIGSGVTASLFDLHLQFGVDGYELISRLQKQFLPMCEHE